MLASLAWRLPDLIRSRWRQKSFFFPPAAHFHTPFTVQWTGLRWWWWWLGGGFVIGGVFPHTIADRCVAVCARIDTYVCVLSVGEPHLCADTHHSPRHQVKQNMEEILIKALSEPGGLGRGERTHPCVCVCVGVLRWAQVY